jgi:hypothetical protein
MKVKQPIRRRESGSNRGYRKRCSEFVKNRCRRLVRDGPEARFGVIRDFAATALMEHHNLPRSRPDRPDLS